MVGEIAAVSCALGLGVPFSPFSGERLCQCVDRYIFSFVESHYFPVIYSKSLSILYIILSFACCTGTGSLTFWFY